MEPSYVMSPHIVSIDTTACVHIPAHSERFAVLQRPAMQEPEMEDGQALTTGRELARIIGNDTGLADHIKIRIFLAYLYNKVPEHIYTTWYNCTISNREYHEEISRILRLETVTYGDLQQLFEGKPRRPSITPIGIHSTRNLERTCLKSSFLH